MPGAPKVRVKNLGPFDRDLPGHGLTVPAGSEVDVTPELGDSLLAQSDAWAQVDAAPAAAKGA